MTTREKALEGFNAKMALAAIVTDTLWGGDVESKSGLNRFIADSYFSGLDLPSCYHHEIAQKLRVDGHGVLNPAITNEEIIRFVHDSQLEEVLYDLRQGATKDLQGKYLLHLADALRVMLDMAFFVRKIRHMPVPFELAVHASTGQPPQLYDVREEIERIRQALGVASNVNLREAVQTWRQANLVPKEAIRAVSDRFLSELDELVRVNMECYLPPELTQVPRTNVKLMLLENPWFSGSFNYEGRRRAANGWPEYEASYELNAGLEISTYEFMTLIAHEVVPGHKTNTSWIHYLCHSGAPGFGFEHTMTIMNTLSTTLAEGIANCAVLMALGVTAIDEIEEPDLRLGVLLANIQEYGKANIAYRLFEMKMNPDQVESITKEECLLTDERANRLTHTWGKHPLLGQMYLPCYAAGTRVVHRVLKQYGLAEAIPALYGVHGPVDILTVQEVLKEKAAVAA